MAAHLLKGDFVFIEDKLETHLCTEPFKVWLNSQEQDQTCNTAKTKIASFDHLVQHMLGLNCIYFIHALYTACSCFSPQKSVFIIYYRVSLCGVFTGEAYVCEVYS